MSFDNKALRCRNCKYWWPVPDTADRAPNREHSARGQCRRHAPPALLAPEPGVAPKSPMWLLTLADDWCGDHMHVGAGG